MAPALPLGRLSRRLQAALLVSVSAALVVTADAAPPAQAQDQARGKAPASAGAAGGNAPGLEAVSPSTPYQIALADYLRKKGAVFYGAWWCPHCFHQKNLFGIEGARKLPYVECDKDDQGRKICTEAKVRAFPTWILGKERREGMLTLEQLSAWSGFQGSPNQGKGTPR